MTTPLNIGTYTSFFSLPQRSFQLINTTQTTLVVTDVDGTPVTIPASGQATVNGETPSMLAYLQLGYLSIIESALYTAEIPTVEPPSDESLRGGWQDQSLVSGTVQQIANQVISTIAASVPANSLLLSTGTTIGASSFTESSSAITTTKNVGGDQLQANTNSVLLGDQFAIQSAIADMVVTYAPDNSTFVAVTTDLGSTSYPAIPIAYISTGAIQTNVVQQAVNTQTIASPSFSVIPSFTNVVYKIYLEIASCPTGTMHVSIDLNGVTAWNGTFTGVPSSGAFNVSLEPSNALADVCPLILLQNDVYTFNVTGASLLGNNVGVPYYALDFQPLTTSEVFTQYNTPVTQTWNTSDTTHAPTAAAIAANLVAGINQLTGDVTTPAHSVGVTAATVALVGGQTASAVATATTTVAAATSSSTANTLVLRSGTGGATFAAVTLGGNASSALQAVPLQQLNSTVAGYLPLTGGTMTGTMDSSNNVVKVANPTNLTSTSKDAVNYGTLLTYAGTLPAGITQLTGDVTTGTGGGVQAATVALVGGQTAANVASTVTTVSNATSANTVSTLVLRDNQGNFTSNNITASGNFISSTAATTNSQVPNWGQVQTLVSQSKVIIASVQTVATTNQNIAATNYIGLTINGYTLAAGDSLLLIAQTANSSGNSQDGVYVVQVGGGIARRADCAAGVDGNGFVCGVLMGTYANYFYRNAAVSPATTSIFGTDPQNWTVYFINNTPIADGVTITQSGQVFSVANNGIGTNQLAPYANGNRILGTNSVSKKPEETTVTETQFYAMFNGPTGYFIVTGNGSDTLAAGNNALPAATLTEALLLASGGPGVIQIEGNVTTGLTGNFAQTGSNVLIQGSGTDNSQITTINGSITARTGISGLRMKDIAISSTVANPVPLIIQAGNLGNNYFKNVSFSVNNPTNNPALGITGAISGPVEFDSCAFNGNNVNLGGAVGTGESYTFRDLRGLILVNVTKNVPVTFIGCDFVVINSHTAGQLSFYNCGTIVINSTATTLSGATIYAENCSTYSASNGWNYITSVCPTTLNNVSHNSNQDSISNLTVVQGPVTPSTAATGYYVSGVDSYGNLITSQFASASAQDANKKTFITVNSNYTAILTDAIIHCNASSSAFTVTLPAISSITSGSYPTSGVDKEYTIIKEDATDNQVTIQVATSTSDLIIDMPNNVTSIILYNKGDSVTLGCAGGSWSILSKRRVTSEAGGQPISGAFYSNNTYTVPAWGAFYLADAGYNNGNPLGNVNITLPVATTQQGKVIVYRNDSTTNSNTVTIHPPTGYTINGSATPISLQDNVIAEFTSYANGFNDIAALIGGTGTYLPLSGGTMTGQIDSSNYVVKVANPTNLTAGSKDAVNYGTLLTYGATITSGINQLTGDVTTPANSVGPTVATVAKVGGQTAAAVALAVTAVGSATANNTVSTIVQRDSSGNFQANNITANGNFISATNATTNSQVPNWGQVQTLVSQSKVVIASVSTVATTNQVVSASNYVGLTINGRVLVAGDTILLIAQSNNSSGNSENGVYVVQAGGTITRRSDCAVGIDGNGFVCGVLYGTYANYFYRNALVSPNTTSKFGQDPQSWTVYFIVQNLLVDGVTITQSGQTISVANNSIGTTQLAAYANGNRMLGTNSVSKKPEELSVTETQFLAMFNASGNYFTVMANGNDTTAASNTVLPFATLSAALTAASTTTSTVIQLFTGVTGGVSQSSNYQLIKGEAGNPVALTTISGPVTLPSGKAGLQLQDLVISGTVSSLIPLVFTSGNLGNNYFKNVDFITINSGTVVVSVTGAVSGYNEFDACSFNGFNVNIGGAVGTSESYVFKNIKGQFLINITKNVPVTFINCDAVVVNSHTAGQVSFYNCSFITINSTATTVSGATIYAENCSTYNAASGWGFIESLCPTTLNNVSHNSSQDSITTLTTLQGPVTPGTANTGNYISGVDGYGNLIQAALPSVAYKTVTTTYTVLASDNILHCNASGGAFTITLPTISSLIGAGYPSSGTGASEFTFIKEDNSTSQVSIQVAGGSDTILDDTGNTTILYLYNKGDSITLTCANHAWSILNKRLAVSEMGGLPLKQGLYSNNTYTLANWGNFYFIDAGYNNGNPLGNVTITLPATATQQGKIILYRNDSNTNTNTVTINAPSGYTIDGNLSSVTINNGAIFEFYAYSAALNDIALDIGGLNTYLPLTGGTLTGPLTLAADPTATSQAATKQYVDKRIGSFIGGSNAVQANNTVGGVVQNVHVYTIPANTFFNVGDSIDIMYHQVFSGTGAATGILFGGVTIYTGATNTNEAQLVNGNIMWTGGTNFVAGLTINNGGGGSVFTETLINSVNPANAITLLAQVSGTNAAVMFIRKSEWTYKPAVGSFNSSAQTPIVCELGYQGTSIVAANSNSAVGFNGTGTSYTYDPYGMHSNTVNPSRITIQYAGTYEIYGNVRLADNSGGSSFILQVFVNGNGLMSASSGKDSSGRRGASVIAVYSANVGDYVELYVYQDSGTSLYVTQASLIVKAGAPYLSGMPTIGTPGQVLTVAPSGNGLIYSTPAAASTQDANKKIFNTVSSAYTALATDSILHANAASAGFTITLPAISSITSGSYPTSGTDKEYTIVKEDTTNNVVTIVGASGDTFIDQTTGLTSVTLTNLGDSVTIACAARSWTVIDKKVQTVNAGSLPYVAKLISTSSATSIASWGGFYLVDCGATPAGNVSLTLPVATTQQGRIIIYREDSTVNSNTLTISPPSGYTINGASGSVTILSGTKVEFTSYLNGANDIVMGNYLPLAGGTMTGQINLPYDPSVALQAATKQYVDNRVGTFVGGSLITPFSSIAGTNTQTYGIPANTFLNNGDVLNAEYTIEVSGSAGQAITFFFYGVNLGTINPPSGTAGTYFFRVRITRVNGTTFNSVVDWIGNSFTASMNRLAGQACNFSLLQNLQCQLTGAGAGTMILRDSNWAYQPAVGSFNSGSQTPIVCDLNVSSSTQTIPTGANTAILFNGTGTQYTYDPYGLHSNTVNPSRITITQAGSYEFYGSVRINNNSGGTYGTLSVVVNGTNTVMQGVCAVNTVGIRYVAVTGSYTASPGDYIELYMIQDSGASLGIAWASFTVKASAPYLSGMPSLGSANQLLGVNSAGTALAYTSNYLPLTGGTMTGTLTLAADPTTTLQSATKQYVDNRVGTYIGGSNGVPALNTSSSNTPQTVHSYTIPANTLLNIGDQLVIDYVMFFNNTQFTIASYLGGISLNSSGGAGNGLYSPQVVHVEATLAAANTINISLLVNSGNGGSGTSESINQTFNTSIAQTLYFTVQATAVGVCGIRKSSWYYQPAQGSFNSASQTPISCNLTTFNTAGTVFGGGFVPVAVVFNGTSQTTYDPYGLHSNTVNNTRITAQYAGYYRMYGNINFNTSASAGYTSQASLVVNGTTTVALSYCNCQPGNERRAVAVNGFYYLNVGDYVELYGAQDTGGTGGVAQASFMIEAAAPYVSGMPSLGTANQPLVVNQAGNALTYADNPRARVHLTNSVAIGGTSILKYDTVEFDNTNSYNTSTGLYTVPQAGVYAVSCYLLLNSSQPAYTFLGAYLYKNGTLYSEMAGNNGGPSISYQRSQGSTILVQCNAGDTLAVYGYCNQAGQTLYPWTTGTGNWMNLYRVGN